MTRAESLKLLNEDIYTIGKIEWSEQAAHYSKRLMFSSLFLLALGYFVIDSTSTFFGLKIKNFDQGVLFAFMLVIASFWMVRFIYRVIQEWAETMPTSLSGRLFGQYTEWQKKLPVDYDDLTKLHEESMSDETFKGAAVDEHSGYLNEFRESLERRDILSKVVKRRLIFLEVIPPILFYGVAVASPIWKCYI